MQPNNERRNNQESNSERNKGPLIVVTRQVPGTIEAVGAEVRIGPEGKLTRAELLELVRGAAVVVTMFHDKVDEEFLEAAGTGLRGVCNFAVGYDNIDVKACAKRGVTVTNTPDAVTEGTANIAWGLILAVARRIVESDAYVRSGRFEMEGPLPITGFLGMHTCGQSLLIVGAGRIGYAVAQRALAFGMRVLYAARSRHVEFELSPVGARRVELDEGLAIADVVSVHTPLTPQTRHLIDARRLRLMRKTAILINTARGPVVDEAALVEALRERRMWGAGLDVFENEPRVHPGLLELRNAVLTPHIGSAEAHWREVMSEMVSENARAILEGREAPNRVGG
ncbi:MAG: D-glycerate dehydrogenase [Phycisphaerales bacterium]|nr:D-glycerate dehydrogenase [Phycisphaerales bacterium]